MPPTPMPPAPPGPAPPGPVAAPPGPVVEYDSLQRTAADACKKRLQQLNFSVGKPVMAPNKEPGTGGSRCDIQSNVFGLEVTKDTCIYSYSVHISFEMKNGKIAVFTKKGKDDFIVRDRHIKCVNIFYAALDQNADFFKMNEDNTLIYDGQGLLFTTIPLLEDGNKKIKLIEVDGNTTNNEDLLELSAIKLEIFRNEKGTIELTQENLLQRTADPNLDVNDRSLTQILELALSQKIIKETDRFGCFEHGKVFILHPENEQGFQASDCGSVGDGKSLLPGLKKSVNFIEGPCKRGHNNPSLIVDAMKAAFHNEETIANKVSSILGMRNPTLIQDSTAIEKASQVIKGLDCYSTHTGKKKHVLVQGVHHLNSQQSRFELNDGSSTTVFQYFKDKYNINLKFPNLNLVTAKVRGNTTYFPMELLTVSRNQRVKIMQQTSDQSKNTTKACAVLPLVRQSLIMNGMNAAGLLENNPVLEALGVKIYPNPLMCSGRTLANNKMRYGASFESTATNGKWRAGKFLMPATIPQWAIFGLSTGRLNDRTLREFAQLLMSTMKAQGIRFQNPQLVETKNPSQLEQCFEYAASQQCKFLFFVTEDGIKTCHETMKFLERKFEIVTQDLKTTVAEKCFKGGKVTLENIVNKTNIKLGGVNYAVVHKSLVEDQLVIGIGVSAQQTVQKSMLESRGILNPSIIGYASNAKSNDEYIGDFLYSAVGSENVIASIEDIIKNSVERFCQSRKGSMPKRVIVYRTGASEGAFGAVLSYEIPLAKAALNEKGCSDTKLIYICVSKNHSVRLFKDSVSSMGGMKAPEQNISPGVVIDSEITHPSYKQFFLNSHTTIQGTAKTPCYTVLYDECNASMDRLEEMTYALTYHHQIVALSTSLPSPLYIALQYAKRGKVLWEQKYDKDVASRSSDSDRERLREITVDLAFKNSSLADNRVNA